MRADARLDEFKKVKKKKFCDAASRGNHCDFMLLRYHGNGRRCRCLSLRSLMFKFVFDFKTHLFYSKLTFSSVIEQQTDRHVK